MKNKMFNKIISFALALVLMLSINIVSFSAYAQGTGTESDPYLITTAEELQNINNNPSASYKLAANIDLNNMDFVPIGNAESGAFSGTFDGAGFTISNLNVFSGKYAGLFGCNEGVIKNVTLDNIYVYGNRYIGGVCAQNTAYGTIESCKVLSGNVESNSGINKIYAGGICGDNSGLIQGDFSNCSDLDIKNTDYSTYVGGIIGSDNGTVSISAYNIGDITTTSSRDYSFYPSSYSGGIIGSASSTLTITITNSYNTGNISSNAYSSAYSGGIIGSLSSSNVEMTNSYNTGNIVSYSSGSKSYSGGIIGDAYCASSNDETTITNNYNTGYISSYSSYDSFSGGIIGYSYIYSSLKITNNYNTGNISSSYSDHYSSGVIGYAYCATSNAEIIIKNCYNTGNTTSSSNDSGVRGIIGFYNTPLSIYDTFNLENAKTPTRSEYSNYYYVKNISKSEMQSMNTYSNWNFDETWEINTRINNGFPTLISVKSPLVFDISNFYTPVYTVTNSTVKITPYKNGSPITDVTWSVTNGDSLVDKNGNITIAEGFSTITATDKEGNKANCNIYGFIPAESISVTNRTINISEGKTNNSSYLNLVGGSGDYFVKYKSSDDSVVISDLDGYLTPVNVGTATITGTTSGGLKAEQKITVTNNATSLSLPSSLTVARNKEQQIVATISPNPSSSVITWSSSNNDVATVDQEGNVTGVSIGQAVITATTDNGYSDTCTVTVNAPVNSMQFEKPSVTIYKNDTDKLKLITDPVDTTDTITYSSSSSSYVSVSSDGTISAKSSEKNVTITATASSGAKAYCTVNVISQPVPVTSITLDTNTKTVQAGEVFKLTDKILPENATNKSVKWKSTDETVATVNQDGTVTAIGEGKAVITVEAENGALDYCEITVNGPNSKNLSKIYIPEFIETSEEYVNIPVIIENNPGINFASLSIMYDPEILEPLSVSNGKVFGSVLGSIDKENSVVKLCFTSEENVTENGQLAFIKFKVIGDSGKDTTVKVFYLPDEIRNAANEMVAFNLFDGAVNIIEHEHTYGPWAYNGDAVYNSSSDYNNGTQTRTCTVCGAKETVEAPNTALLRRRGNSIALESSITLTTYITKDVVDYYDEVYAEFTRNGKTEKVYASNEVLTSGSTQYNIFEYSGISPQAMVDDVEITFYGIKDGVKYWGDTYTYSITDYVKTTLSKPDSTDKLKTMLVDLMYYGAACQTYQNYKTDQLMTDILTEEQKRYRSTYELELNNIKDSSYQTCENRLVKFGTTLRLNDAVEMAIALNMTDVNIEDLTFKVIVGTRELTYTYAENPENFEKGEDGYWYFYFDGVYAHQMNEEVFITAYKDDEQVSYTLRYNIESYAAIVTDAKLKAVTDAMMYYGNSAKSYAG